MDQTAALIAIQTLRMNPAYHQAEILRRQTKGGAVAMAAAKENSPEFAAVHLLVNTWEIIATIVASVEQKDELFENMPICHMFENLKEAIPALSARHSNVKSADEFQIPNAGYGAKFSMLAGQYHNWLIEKNKSAHYISAACGGIHAFFG